MIVVAIIGILAAMAIPIYQGHVIRTQVTRVYAELSNLRTQTEDLLSQGRLPADASDELGYSANNLLSAEPAVDFSAGDGSGSIIASFGNNASSTIHGAIMTLSRSASGSWACTLNAGTASGWHTKYSPAGCD
ncbi:MAG: pilin [Chromatiales bacterium]|nr:pilin [Chromatiales bacterium]